MCEGRPLLAISGTGSKGEVGQTEKVMPEPPKRWWGPRSPFLAAPCFETGYQAPSK